PLGVQDGRIPDRAFSASSVWDRNHGASNARLHSVRRGRRTGAWSAKRNRRGEWLQVDVGSRARITGIATQGRQDYNQWVTRYTLKYSNDGIRFRTYIRGRRIVVSVIFRGNRDRNSLKENLFDPPFTARYVRIYPWTWHKHISLRAEFF
ncbi:predicted protein, partial [Nematostella vectensis]